MRLTDLLNYDDIVIQCHDKPDVDAVASGFALFRYLERNGKSPRLVYAGTQRTIRGSLREMIWRFGIPLTYLTRLESEAQLLVTVDCRAGERNVSALPCQNLAVIDHHAIKEGETLPRLHEVRTESDGYTSCATVLWAMLKEVGFPTESDGQLPTLLYYGLYMDTQELKTVRRMDKEMLDEFKCDRDIVTQLQSANLSLEEICITGRAYNSLHTHSEYRFAVAQVESCDPDILGIVGDELMKVAGVDISVAYCILEGGEGAKISVRCRRQSYSAEDIVHCRRQSYSAEDIVHWLVRSMGNDGGGTPTKAAGRLPKELLEEACAGDDWDDLSGAAGRLIYRLLTDYFQFGRKQIRTGEYSAERVKELCGTEAALFRKKKVPVGYVRATDLFPEGEEILIRMLEADVRRSVTQDLYLMIGVDGEVYHSKASKLREAYDLLEEPFLIDSTLAWQPKIFRYADHEVRLLAPYAKKCIARDEARIQAAQLSCRTEVLTQWGEWHLGEAGDWLVSRETDPQDIYTIKRSIFEKTYEKVDAGRA